MAHHVCPRCHRVNPGNAVYCWFDGIVLQQHAGSAVPVPGQLPGEFVFPSKRRCRTIDDFVQGCQYEWEEARELLRRGDFARFFQTVGRMDLARTAHENAGHADPDIGLHNFLHALPVTQLQGPRLDLNPRRLVLGKLRPGETKELKLQVLNLGKGLLQGKLAVAEGGHWLRVGDNGECALKTGREQEVTIRIDTRGLAAPASYSARLTVITNGGIAEIPVRLDLGASPFGSGPFKGASSPREMAEKMRTNPKAAVPLLENGDIQRWFAANGWNYPVRGVQATGVAAVQQFFEAMGLSKPPPVQLSESEIHCLCIAPEVSPREVVLRTAAKKWIYAQADSDVPWLRVLTPNVAGAQQAVIAFEVDSSLMDEGKIHEGRIQVVANAGQVLMVRVRVDVRRPQRPFTRRLFGPFLTMAILALAYRMILAVPSDLLARVLLPKDREPPPGSLERWVQSAVEEEGYLRRFVFFTWWLGPLLGALVLWRREGKAADVIYGALAGTLAGVAAAATAACVMTAGDGVPRRLLAALGQKLGESPWVGTPLWLLLVALWWAALGAATGMVLWLAGQRGRRLLAHFARPLTGLLELFGMKRAAAAFAAR
jgi:hypothetical protein